MRMKSANQHNFAIIPQNHHQRSAFKCDHSLKTSFNSGLLIPFLWDEVNPGDTVNLRLTAMVRFATLLFPLMDNIKFYTYYFFCPLRLIWTNSQKFFGAQDNPGDSIAYVVPYMTSTASTGYATGSVFDYFGLPTKVPGFNHISMPLRAYNLMYNQWFRDENLQNSVTVNLGDTSDSPTDYSLLPSGKIRDYFTACLPFTQKGTAVEIPLGTTAPVIGIGKINQNFDGAGGTFYDSTGSAVNYPFYAPFDYAGGVDYQYAVQGSAATGGFPQIYADLSEATASTINSMRTAFQIQRFLERDARGGTRYQELILSHFGVFGGDARLQRVEYLSGGRHELDVSVVAQTAPASGGSTPLANLAGFGTAVLRDSGFVKSFVEHGILLGIICARADLTYQQGLNRKWSRNIRYDYPWPVFAHLGEQAVLNQEIYTQGSANPTQDAAVFGYQERYAENRYYPNQVTGLFRSNATGTLDAWHLAQEFGSLPTLGSTFIVDNPPTTRVKAVNTDPDFIMDAVFHHTVVSCLPTYSVPGYIDHF